MQLQGEIMAKRKGDGENQDNPRTFWSQCYRVSLYLAPSLAKSVVE